MEVISMMEFGADFWWNFLKKKIKDADMGTQYNKDKLAGKDMSEIDDGIAKGIIMGMILVNFNLLSKYLETEEIIKATSSYSM